MTILFLLFILAGGVAFLTSKFIKNKKIALMTFFLLLILFVSPIISLSWGGLHRIVYANSEIAFFATLVFGFVGSIITILSGTFIPFWIWHVFNNLYAGLSQLPRVEDVIFISLILYGLFIGLVVTTELLVRKFKRKVTGDEAEDSF